MAAGGARGRQRVGRDQRSGSTGRTLAAAGVYARSVSFSPASWRLHRPLFFILDEHASDPWPRCARRLANDNGSSVLAIVASQHYVVPCGFTPVYALLGRFLPKLKAASGRPPFLAIIVRVRPTATRGPRCSFCDLAVDPALLASGLRARKSPATVSRLRRLVPAALRSETMRASPIARTQRCECRAVEGVSRKEPRAGNQARSR